MKNDRVEASNSFVNCGWSDGKNRRSRCCMWDWEDFLVSRVSSFFLHTSIDITQHLTFNAHYRRTTPHHITPLPSIPFHSTFSLHFYFSFFILYTCEILFALFKLSEDSFAKKVAKRCLWTIDNNVSNSAVSFIFIDK